MLDYIFDSVESTQCEVYDILVRPLVDKALNGYDATFIAIGQTGSGKTYTVGFESSVSIQKFLSLDSSQLHFFFHFRKILGNI